MLLFAQLTNVLTKTFVASVQPQNLATSYIRALKIYMYNLVLCNNKRKLYQYYCLDFFSPPTSRRYCLHSIAMEGPNVTSFCIFNWRCLQICQACQFLNRSILLMQETTREIPRELSLLLHLRTAIFAFLALTFGLLNKTCFIVKRSRSTSIPLRMLIESRTLTNVAISFFWNPKAYWSLRKRP